MNLKDMKLQMFEASSIADELADISDDELDKMVDQLEWDDIDDLYPEDEEKEKEHLEKLHGDDEDEDEDEEEDIKEEVLDEKLSVQSRLRKKMSMVRRKARTTLARNLKLRRAATFDVIQKRARVAARRALYKKFLRGRDKSQLSAAEKDRVEGQVARMRSIQAILATKMITKIRKLEQQRLANLRSKRK